MTAPRPCSAPEAVLRASSMVNTPGGEYVLYPEGGGGDYRPFTDASGKTIDLPWTTVAGHVGSDCCGFAISYCYKLPRHRPGFNHGSWATVADDINCNSAIEDADHNRELFQRVFLPEPGVLLCYPTIRLVHEGKLMEWVGHVAIVTGISRASGWNPSIPDYSLLDVAQCCGPNGRRPGVIATDGSIWNQHDHNWTKPEHRTAMLRALP